MESPDLRQALPALAIATGLATIAVSAMLLTSWASERSFGGASPGARNAADVLRAADVALAVSPVNSAAWLQRAYARRIAVGYLDAQALSDLTRSFDVAPLDPDVFEWRTRFALSNWRRLSPELRQRVLAQMNAGKHVPAERMALISMSRGIADPGGRLALRLVLSTVLNQKSPARAVQ